jgi:hypothetical protein
VEFVGLLEDLVEAERVLSFKLGSNIVENTEKPRVWWIEFNVADTESVRRVTYHQESLWEAGSDNGEMLDKDEEMEDEEAGDSDQEMQDEEEGAQRGGEHVVRKSVQELADLLHRPTRSRRLKPKSVATRSLNIFSRLRTSPSRVSLATTLSSPTVPPPCPFLRWGSCCSDDTQTARQSRKA